MRISSTIVILLSIFVLPYWIYLPMIIIGIVLFPLYMEAVALALLVDIIYGQTDNILFGLPMTFISAILVLFVAPLREYLRFNA